MKIFNNVKPEETLKIYNNNGCANITFIENVKEIEASDQEGMITYEYEEYYVNNVPYYDNLKEDIKNNYSTWLNAAKQNELQNQKVNLIQLKADVDYLLLISSLNIPSTLNENSTSKNQEVFEKALIYYPNCWNKDKINNLLTIGLITEEQYNQII